MYGQIEDSAVTLAIFEFPINWKIHFNGTPSTLLYFFIFTEFS